MTKICCNRPLVLAGLGAVLLTSACAPSPIPTGYTYHAKPYKSANPPAPDAPKHEKRAPVPAPQPVGAPALVANPADETLVTAPVAPVDVSQPIEQSQTLSADQADQFRLAVYSLAENLTRRAGMPPKTVFVMKPQPPSPFYDMMDRDVREALRHLNYRLSDTPENSYIFTYAAQPVTGAPQGGERGANMRVSLFVYNEAGPGARLLTEESKEFYIEDAERLGAVLPPPPASAAMPSPRLAPISSMPDTAASPKPGAMPAKAAPVQSLSGNPVPRAPGQISAPVPMPGPAALR